MEYQSSDHSEKKVFAVIGVLSALVLAFLVWLIYFKPGATAPAEMNWINSLPSLNALLNSLTTIFLISGIVFIKNNMPKWHIRSMLMATLTSAIFLISYITYHHFHGDTKFLAQGMVRTIYFIILISHILLSAVQVPLILSTLYLGLSKKYEKHRKVAKITFPIWLYVSITGVLIFVFLKWFNV
jgi:putative membrane protein